MRGTSYIARECMSDSMSEAPEAPQKEKCLYSIGERFTSVSHDLLVGPYLCDEIRLLNGLYHNICS